MEVNVERVIDSDSAIYNTPDGDRLRDRSNNVAGLESTTTTGKQSAKGIDQTQKAKVLVHSGDKLTIEDDPEKGVFGRVLVSPKKNFNGKEVDLNAMKASLGINSYYTKYGVSEDNHENLKSTYDDWLPYQFSDEVGKMTKEEFIQTGEQLGQIHEYIGKIQSGETPEAQLFLDTLIGDTFGDGGQERVSKFLDINKRLEVMRDRENMPLSGAKVIYEAFKDPRMQEEWDRSVIARQGQDEVRLKHKGDKTFMEEAGAAMQLLNDVSNVVDRKELWNAENLHMQVTDDVLSEVVQDIPPELRGKVFNEAKKFGNERAYVMAEQLKEDIADNSIFDDMGLAKQFLYGAAAVLASPLSALVGGKGFQLAAKASKAVRMWESSNVLKAAAHTKVWTAAAGADAIMVEGPRLIGDHTYTPRDMVLDVALDTTMGAALPLAFMGGSKVIKPFISKFLAERTANKQSIADKLSKDLKNEFTKETTSDSNVEQMLRGVHGEEEARRLNTSGEKTVVTNGKESSPVVEGDTPTSTYGTGTGPEQGVPPIGDRPAHVGDDGVGRPHGEMDIEESLSRPVIHNTPWLNKVEGTPAGEYPKPLEGTLTRSETVGSGWDRVWGRADYTAAKKAGVRLDNNKSWTPEESARFDKEYSKLDKDPKTKELTQQELDAIESQTRAEDLINGGWIKSGLDEMHTKAKKYMSNLAKVGSTLANVTGRAMSHSLQKSENSVMRFIGHNLLEDPMGYGGNLKRHTTAALRSANEKNLAMSQIMPNYAKHIDNWAADQGAGLMERLRTTWGTSDGNAKVLEFENQFIDAINARKMGRQVDDLDVNVKAMLDDWQKFTDYAGKRAIHERLPGWGKLRTNYFPQVRNNQKMANHIEKTGVEGAADLTKMFERAILNTRDAGLHDLDDRAIRDLAKKIVKQAKTGEKDLPDSTSSKLGRAQSRVEMDWSAEYNGLKMKDFLHTDIALTADKYTSDLGGRLALNKVTGGKIVTDADLAGLKTVAYAKHAEAMEGLTSAGKNSAARKLEKTFKKESQMLDDTFNMVLGRPPRGGLAPELRHLKAFTTLTRMGVLGTSQSIETGNIIARNVMDMFNDREVLSHILAMSPDTPEGKALLKDIMNITGRTKDMEYLHRPSQVLDEESMKSYSDLRQLSIMMADKATGGDLKQPASRLLGKTSMFNWVQKNQSEFVQKSFLIHTDAYFNKGKCSITPARMVDLGLINRDGTNTELAHTFKNIVKKDRNGHIVDLQWKKWSKKSKEQYMDAAQRDEAQRLQQTFAGEAPSYYNKPLMNLLMQFREVPLVAQNKQLARNLAFGDVEAASSVMLNFAIAGMVRYGWIGGLGYAKAVAEGETDNYKLPGLNRLDIMRYMAAGGMYPDAVTMAESGFQSYKEGNANELASQLPVYGVLKDGVDFALGNNENNNRAEALQGLTMLGTTWYMDIIHTMFVKNINEMATHKEQEGE